MRIVVLTQYYPPETGAPQNRLADLAERLVRAGHDVTVLTALPNYPRGEIFRGYRWRLVLEECSAGLRIIRVWIHATNRKGIGPRLLNYFSFVLSSVVVGMWKLGRHDVLLTESPPLFLGISGFLLSRLKRAKWVFNVSDLWPESAVRLNVIETSSLSFKIGAGLERFCYSRAWLVTGQSKSILSDIRERFPDRPTFHLSNGVDLSVFSADRRTDTARAMLNGTRGIVAVYAGLHGLAQGLDQVLEAANALRDEPNLQFVLIGDGPEKKALVQTANQRELDNVRFMDPVPGREVPALIAASDIVIVPLKTYIPGAVPSKLYEAMASARPVILVADGEAADIVREHEAGIVVRPGDVNGLVKALSLLCGQPGLRERLGANGRRAARDYFDRAQIAKSFIEHLEKSL